MALNIYLGTFAYLVDVCPRKSRIRLLFTVAKDRDAAQAIFRRFITREPDYHVLLGITDEKVMEPLPPTDPYTVAEARSFVTMLLRHHFEYVDQRSVKPSSVPDVGALVTADTDEIVVHGFNCGDPDGLCPECSEPR